MLTPLTFRPRLWDALRHYTQADLSRDLVAGVTVGLVALPLAMAFGIASGVDPKAGIYTAIVAGFLISLLGGSRVQIGGPTGAFVAIVYGILTQYGLNNLILCTLMAGCILIIMGVARMGAMVKYIPYPVTMGFTSGIAVLILATQIKDFFGLALTEVPPDFTQNMVLLARHAGTFQVPALLLASLSLGVMVVWPARWARRVPGILVALVAATLCVVLLDADHRWSVETIGSRFGGIPKSLPAFQWPA